MSDETNSRLEAIKARIAARPPLNPEHHFVSSSTITHGWCSCGVEVCYGGMDDHAAAESQRDLHASWVRLGKLLLARRVELGYPNMAAFGRQHELRHTRTLSDIEKGRRDNYGPATIAHVEQLYRWRPGSVASVLAGGEPTPIGAEDAHRVLRDHARGLIEHTYAGLCPHEDDPDVRDPNCPVCAALNAVQA
jgi:hypothetical protein